MPSPAPRIGHAAIEALRPLKDRAACPPGKDSQGRKAKYRPRDPKKSRLRRIIARELERAFDLWEKFEEFLGPWKYRYQQAAVRFLDCGIMEKGFARFRCPDCGHGLRVAFSCKSRLCPSCARKRMTQWGAWLTEEMLLDLPHRHWVFTLPREVRVHFRDKRWLLNKLSSTSARVLMRQMAIRCGEAGAIPGVIAVAQTAGDQLAFNPHIHIIATTHCLGPSGRLHEVKYIPYVKLSRIWKSAVLALLRNTQCITREESDKLWKRYLKGFNLNGEIKETLRDPEAAKRLAEYLVRPAMPEHRIAGYSETDETVMFRGRGVKDRRTGRRPERMFFMRAAEFAARLLIQVPPKRQKLVNYYGIYSNKVRGMWKKRGFDARKLCRKLKRKRRGLLNGWRSQIWRVYEADPLECPSCGSELVLLDLVLPPYSSILDKPP